METSSQPRSPPSPASPPSFTTLLPVPLSPVFPQNESTGTTLFPVFSPRKSTSTALFLPSVSTITALFPQSQSSNTAFSPQNKLTNAALSPQSKPIYTVLFPQRESINTALSPQSKSANSSSSPQSESTSSALSPQSEFTSTALSPQSKSTDTALLPAFPKIKSTEPFVNHKEEWLSDSDSQNTMICSTTSSSPGPSVGSTSTAGGGQIIAAGSSKSKINRTKEAPAGQKPAQVVARRNARERRRVQAVNWAFARLRKVVPLEDNKSKRMSKVKTLQLAIEYINQLQGVLTLQNQHNTQNSPELQQPQEHQPQEHQQQHHQLLTTADINLFSDVQYRLDQNELQFRMPPNFYTQLLTDNQN